MEEKPRAFLRDPLQRLGAIPDYLSLTKPQTSEALLEERGGYPLSRLEPHRECKEQHQ